MRRFGLSTNPAFLVVSCYFNIRRYACIYQADEEYFAQNGEPLFSSHMLDLSEEVSYYT